LNERASPPLPVRALRTDFVAVDRVGSQPDHRPRLHHSRERAIEASERPIVSLRCHSFIDNAGVALMFSLADWPGAGGESWLYAIKTPASSWRLLQTESDGNASKRSTSGIHDHGRPLDGKASSRMPAERILLPASSLSVDRQRICVSEDLVQRPEPATVDEFMWLPRRLVMTR
jgi:hypothetical protein